MIVVVADSTQVVVLVVADLIQAAVFNFKKCNYSAPPL
jgi:hypothetical protein